MFISTPGALDRPAHLPPAGIRQRWNRADAFIENDLFYTVNRKENRVRLDPALLAMRDVIHPVFKSVQVDAADGNAVGRDIEQASEEALSWTLKINNDDGIQ